MPQQPPCIDKKRCIACGVCVEVCTAQIRDVVDNAATIVKPDACVWCKHCEMVCPSGAANCPFEITFEYHECRSTTVTYWKKKRQ
jgi:ferredoxin